VNATLNRIVLQEFQQTASLLPRLLEVKAAGSSNPVIHKAADRFLSKVVGLEEGSQKGLFAFGQDVASVYLPKTLLAFGSALAEVLKTAHSSTGDFLGHWGKLALPDWSEASFLEFVENGFMYLVGDKTGRKNENLFHNPQFSQAVFGKKFNDTIQDLVTKPVDMVLEHTNVAEKREAVFLKLANYLTSVAAITGMMEVVLTPAKNLLTLGVFNKSRYSAIANFDSKEAQTPEELAADATHKNKIKQQSLRNIALSVLASAGLLASAAVLVRRGPAVESKVFQNTAEFLVKHLDFKRVTDKNGKWTAGFSDNVLRTIVMMGVFGYLTNQRDKWEGLDNLRLLIVAPYIMFGREKFREWIFNTATEGAPADIRVPGEKKLLPLAKIVENSLEFAKAKLAEECIKFDKIADLKGAEQERLFQVAAEHFLPRIQAKGKLLASAFVLGSMAVGGSITILARVLVNLRYQAEQKETEARKQQQLSKSPLQPVASPASLFAATQPAFEAIATIDNPWATNSQKLPTLALAAASH
jgi:hypothetical protein